MLSGRFVGFLQIYSNFEKNKTEKVVSEIGKFLVKLENAIELCCITPLSFYTTSYKFICKEASRTPDVVL